MALEEAILLLAILTPIAKTVPVLGSPVEGSLEALRKLLELAKGVKSNKEKTKELAVQATRWLDTVVKVLKELELKANHSILEGLRPNMEDIHNALNAIVEFTEHSAKRGTFGRTIRKAKDEETLSTLRNTLEEAFERFKMESHLRMEKALNTLLTDAEIEKLKTLKPVFSARFSSLESPDGCLKHTREDVLDTMLSWAADASSSFSSMSVFWLAGLAGTGKSTIMKTLCQRINHDDRFLLASFFASRNSAERRDPYAILHTFAYELSTASELIRPHVLSAVLAPGDILKQPMYEQVKELLAKPIAEAKLNGITIVLAIDALDECQKSAGVEGGPLIELLAQVLQNQPVKLIVTSRQEDSIASIFRSLASVSLRLHEIASAIVEADVRRMFDAGFADIRQSRAGELGTDPWPTRSQLNTLVHLTGPFFTYASTMLKFVGDPRFSPKTRLEQILQHGSAVSSDGRNAFSQIDALYADVLRSVTAGDDGDIDLVLCRRVGELLRTIVLLEEPVSVRALTHLIGVSDNFQEVENDVRALASVLLISGRSGAEEFSETVSTFHPSFRDFLIDPRRCTDERFLVTPAEDQQKLLCRCLQLLNESLHYDICGIRIPGRANADIQNLSTRVSDSLSDALRYACQFWPVHLVACGSLTKSISQALSEFCANHLYHWLEVLSLLGRLSLAGEYLPGSIAWCQSHLTSSASMHDISSLLGDADHAVRDYAVPISSHALQVYHSVLATGPACELLKSMQRAQIATPHLVSQRASDWTSSVQVLEGHKSRVLSVACSLDGDYIVSGSSDETVRVWDAHTGKELAVLEGHCGDVRSVAFSPKGARLISGSGDSTVRVWDAWTGQQLMLLEGHTGSVWSVAFSPDGACIVSGSSDSSVRLWDAQTGVQLALLVGHSSVVQSVAISPDGKHIVSGSYDQTVRVWDAQTGEQLSVLEGHNDYVESVAFSSDGAQIISSDVYGRELAWNAGDVYAGLTSPITGFRYSRSEALVWNFKTGWISWQRSDGSSPCNLCWVPEERRGYAFACHGTTAVIGARQGTVTILDFSDFLATLEGLSYSRHR